MNDRQCQRRLKRILIGVRDVYPKYSILIGNHKFWKIWITHVGLLTHAVFLAHAELLTNAELSTHDGLLTNAGLLTHAGLLVHAELHFLIINYSPDHVVIRGFCVQIKFFFGGSIHV